MMWIFKKHTIHPSNDKAPKPSVPQAWGTPDSTPVHTVVPPIVSSGEKKLQHDHDPKHLVTNMDRVFTPKKLKLHPSSPPPEYKLKDSFDESIELKGLKKSEFVTDKDSIEQIDKNEEITLPPIETPQSPVPPLPEWKKKWKWVQIPAWCDPCVPIDPQGRVYNSWLFLVTICYSYNAWCIALRATFPYQTPENTPHWMMMDYFCDLIYLLDLVLLKPRLMFLQEGFWVDDPKETRKNYKRKLQYKFDVISLTPLDLLYFYFGPQKVVLRFPRILKLQTFWEFHQAMDRVLSSPYVVRIGKMLFYILYLIHLNACAYYAMSAYIGLGSNEWVYDNQGNAYIRCFYFATKTATSIGKNPKPENTEEYLFMTAAWLMGVFVFALLIGQIRDIIATATRARTEYRKTVDGCTQYLRRLNMPAPLIKRVTAWFNYTWTQQRCFDESKILNALPYNMKRDVALEVHMSTLSKVQLFRDCSDSLLRDLVLQLRPVSFLPGDTVVRAGEVGRDMYIIKSGECWVVSAEDEVLATLSEGHVFGEISLLGIEGLRRRIATVRSRGYSTLFCLSRSDLDAALKHHKEAAHILRMRADQIIRENAARQVKQKMEKEAKHPTLRHRRPSGASSMQRGLRAQRARGRRFTSASTQLHNGRRLSALSEDEGKRQVHSARPSISSTARTPIPTIEISGE